MLNAGSDVAVLQRDLLESVDSKASNSWVSFSTVNGRATWDFEITELKLTVSSKEECVHVGRTFCVESLPIQ